MDHTARLEVLGEHPDAMRIGRWKNLVIVSWRGQATGPAVATLIDVMRRLHAGPDEVRSYIHLLPDQVALPDAEARAGISWVMSHYEPLIACAAVVVQGGGFWASAMRNVVIGLRLLMQTPFEYRIDTAAHELLAWLPDAHLARTGVRITAHELLELLDEGRRWQQPDRKTQRMSVFRAR